MIDEKKIEEAANLHRFELIASMHGSTLGTPMQCFKEVVDAETELIENSFITGAKWAINEFLKDLWHDGEETPKEKNKYVLMWFESYYVDVKELDTEEYYELSHTGKDGFDENTWEMFCNEAGWCSKWLYIDDLFSK